MRFLLACLAVQAALLGFRLDLLDLWADETFTIETAALPPAEVRMAAARDIHPPLYYLLQHYWLKVPVPISPAVQARLLSVLFALLATVALDRLWAVRLPGKWRRWLLALWVLSPCLVLYARMARSYSLQLLLVFVTVYLAERYLRSGEARDLLFVAGGIAAAFYTHYVPGAALAVATAAAFLRQGKWKPLGVVGAGALLLYLPWLWVMAESLGKWTRSGQGYALTGEMGTELLLKAAFASVSLVVGESLPWWALAAGVLLLPVAAWFAVKGAAKEPGAAMWTAVLAAVGFLGVARWVSYPFVPARLLFLLPFLMLLFIRGCEARPKAGVRAMGALALISALGLWGYYRKSDYLNKGYAMPFREIAERIREAPPAESLVICDSLNTDYPALRHYLGTGRHLVLIGHEQGEALVATALNDPGVRTVWLVRNLHDISPGRQNSRVSERLGALWRTERFGYLPLAPFERWAAAKLEGRESPQFFYEAARFRR